MIDMAGSDGAHDGVTREQKSLVLLPLCFDTIIKYIKLKEYFFVCSKPK